MFTDEQITTMFDRQVHRRLNALGIDQRELARRVGISEVSLSRYLNGRRDPGLSLIIRMAEALECEPSFLVDIYGSTRLYKEDEYCV